jgi:hypothetical protein
MGLTQRISQIGLIFTRTALSCQSCCVGAILCTTVVCSSSCVSINGWSGYSIHLSSSWVILRLRTKNCLEVTQKFMWRVVVMSKFSDRLWLYPSLGKAEQ